MCDAAIWPTIVGSITTMVSGLGGALGGYFLAARNDEKRDERAANREKVARDAARVERLSDQRNETQRQTLFDLQDELHNLCRFTLDIMLYNQTQINEARVAATKLPDATDIGYADSARNIARLKTRVLDENLRSSISEFTAICTRAISTKPQAGDSFTRRFTDVNNGHDGLTDQLGVRVRDELDRLR